MTKASEKLGIDDELSATLDAEVGLLAQSLRRACEGVDLHQVLSFSDPMGILIDRTYTTGETLRPCIAQWLASSFANQIDATSAKLAALVSANGEVGLAKAQILLADRLDRETSDAKSALLNRLSLEFSKDFCDEEGHIDWPKLVEFNSGNMNH